MKIDLSNRTALVTGSTQGIGFAIATGLAQSGADVVLNGREQRTVDNAVARLRSLVSSAAVSGIAADLGVLQDHTALVKKMPAVDILVNNASAFSMLDFFEVSDEVWTQLWNLNVMAGIRLARAYLRGMEQKGWGRVVFISSDSAFNAPAAMIAYGVSKTAEVAVARGLAKRMAGTGVTVNSVLPGPTLTERVHAMFQEEARKTGKPVEELATAFVREHRPSSIIRRMATVEEVANIVVYLASPLASATTGAAVRVDGGLIDSL
jgi:NAD(P)-dependent dehydrogenase (short-subunit alcohol dehydrogenase family)